MGVFVITTVTVILMAFTSLFAVSQATCPPCPFKWSEHQHHCYRYFPWSLQYDHAKVYCRRYNSEALSGGLAAVSSLDELTFLMKYVGEIMNQTSKLNVGLPFNIWLNKSSRSYENYNMIYYNALNADRETDANFTSCNTSSPAVVFSLSEIGTGSSSMVLAPEVVEHKCAVYVGEGAYTDLGDFAGTCVSDPDVCVSQTVTWSLWMKIHPSMLTTGGARYFVSSGGRTAKARGISILFVDSNTFKVEVRSERPDASWGQSFTLNWISIDAWFHVVVIGDINYVGTGLFVYVDGNLLTESFTDTRPVSPDDKCTRLYLGAPNPCGGTTHSSVTYGASAAYSNLMVFDNVLTPEQIQSLHACGSLDWGLKVRSLHLDHTYMESGNLRYVCKASASSGPTIYWRMYHADQAQWEDLDLWPTGAGVDITPTSFSTCVVQSVLVIDQSRGPSSEGDIISCTASSGSLNTSVYIRQGEDMTYVYSDHNNEGLFISKSRQQNYPSGEDGGTDLGSYPFICEKESRGLNE